MVLWGLGEPGKSETVNLERHLENRQRSCYFGGHPQIKVSPLTWVGPTVRDEEE